MKRLEVLDGWRGISILCVLAAHLLPLGPKSWALNAAAGYVGMVIFFCLSGFLITTFLLHHSSVIDFLIRRFFRIIPLAYVALAIGLWLAHPASTYYPANFLFYANLPPFWLTDLTAHFWSLCVEVQFYVGVAILFAIVGRRGLFALPVLCLAVTAFRIYSHEPGSIVTWFRLDEILAGATLALLCDSGKVKRLGTPWIWLPLLLVSAHSAAGSINYLRPYFAAALVGSTLVSQPRVLKARIFGYIAEISYALYILHPLVMDTWLGTGTKLVKYLKRPLLLAVLVGIAHTSTFWYEHRWISFGKRLSWKLRSGHGVTAIS